MAHDIADDGKLCYLQGATKSDHEMVQLKQRRSNGVNKPVNCEVIRSAPLQDSPFILKECRYKFYNKKPYLPQSQDGNIRTTRTTIYHSSLRSSEPVFHFTEHHCLFCNKPTYFSGTKEVSMFSSQNVLIFKQL